MELSFSQELKTQALSAFKYSKYLGQIMSALELNNSSDAREYMMMAIDELQQTINQKIGDDEAQIHNGRINVFQNMNDVWAKLIDEIEHFEDVIFKERTTKITTQDQINNGLL